MAIASGSRHGMSYVAETVYGQTPATPVFKYLRHRPGVTLGMTKETFQSEEIRSDRQTADLRHGTKSISGDIPVELSPGTYDDFLEALLGGTWDDDAVKVGNTRRSFTIERHFADIGQYLRYTGCEMNSLQLSASPSGIVQATFGVIGKGQQQDTSAIAGATYGAATTSSPYDGFSGAITEGGSPIAVVTEVSLSVNNNLQTQFVIGSDETLQPSIGRIVVEGSITAFFEDASLIDKFINETESSLTFTLGGSGSGIKFTLPRIKYTGGSAPEVGGEGSVTLALPFTALYDANSNTTITIERNV